MTFRHDEHDLTSSAGPATWLVDTARRNPEALLVLASGVALLLRGGRSSAGTTGSGYRRAAQYSGEPPHDGADVYDGGEFAESGREQQGRIEAARESVGEMARDASEYASDVAERVYETASSYASSVASYADEQRRYLTRQASRMSDQADEMLHERPLAVAALGLAAGAAIAAILPPTQVERRTIRPARDRILETASRTADAMVKAAADTVTHVQEEAAERGLSAEGLKEMARDAGEIFTKTVSQEATKAAGIKPGGGEFSAKAAPSSSTQVRPGIAPSTPASGSASASGSGRQGAGGAGSGSTASPAVGGDNRLGPGATGTPSGGALDRGAGKGPASGQGTGGGTGTDGGSGLGGGTKR